MGVGHATELTYLYPQHDGGQVAGKFTPDERKIADAMARYWGAFAIRGEPEAKDLPAWSAFASSNEVMSFGDDGKIALMSEADFQKEHKCEFWNGLANKPVK